MLSLLSQTKTVVHLTDESLYIYRISGAEVNLIGVFSWSDENFVSDVVACLTGEGGGAPVIILNDAVDQHYRKEKVPSVRSLDSSGIVKRKIALAYPHYPYRAYTKLKTPDHIKNVSGSVKNNYYLFAACPDSQNLQKLLMAITESEVLVKGFTLLPMESVSMVTALSGKIFETPMPASENKLKSLLGKSKEEEVDRNWTIFIGQNRSGGLRQIVVRDNELALTRITPIVETDIEKALWSQDIAREFQATMSYLARFGYTPADTLNIIIIADEEAKPHLEKMIRVEKGRVQPVTLSEATTLLKIRPEPDSEQRFADDLHVGWVGKQSRLKLPLNAKQFDKVVRPRQAASLAMGSLVLLLAGTTYYCAETYLQYYAMKRNVAQAMTELNQVNNIYNSEIERKKALGINIGLIQSSFEINDELEEESIDIFEILKDIRKAQNGQIHMDKITFAKREKTGEQGGAVPLAGQEGGPEEDKIIGLYMSFPGDYDIAKGNEIVANFSERLEAIFKNSAVTVTKVLKDVSYRGEITSEAGVTAAAPAREPLTAEIEINLDSKVGEEPQTL